MATAPNLGVAQQFSVLGKSGVTGSTGTGTVVIGDVGSSPTPSVTNFPPSSVAPPFTLHTSNNATVIQAQVDATLAYNNLLAQGAGTPIPAQLDGQVLTAGIYSEQVGTFDLANNGTLTLNGDGIFIFQVSSALQINTGANIVGTANPCNIYWRVGTSATILGDSFRGTVIADASITVASETEVEGRLLAGTGATGAVTISGSGGNTIGGCASPASCPTITVNPIALPVGQDTEPYSATVSGSGGTPPYTFSLTSGAFPTGLSLNSSTGEISGTPTATGTFNITITATDDNGCIGSRAYVLLINASSCPVITLLPATLPNGAVGSFYNRTITAPAGAPPVTFSIFSGALPNGLTLNETTGVISGRARRAGKFTFAILAIDANGCAGLQTYSIRIIGFGGFNVGSSNCPPCQK